LILSPVLHKGHVNDSQSIDAFAPGKINRPLLQAECAPRLILSRFRLFYKSNTITESQ
jgi:hypothetical protein